MSTRIEIDEVKVADGDNPVHYIVYPPKDDDVVVQLQGLDGRQLRQEKSKEWEQSLLLLLLMMMSLM